MVTFTENHPPFSILLFYLLGFVSIFLTWYQEYARSDGSMRMVMILALGLGQLVEACVSSPAGSAQAQPQPLL